MTQESTNTIEDVYHFFSSLSGLPEEQIKFYVNGVYEEHKNNLAKFKKRVFKEIDFDPDESIFAYLKDGHITGIDWEGEEVITPGNEFTELYIDSFGETDPDSGLESIYVVDYETFDQHLCGLITTEEYNSKIGEIEPSDVVINFKTFYPKLEKMFSADNIKYA